MRTLLLVFAAVSSALAQGSNHVQWAFELSPASARPGGRVVGRLEATIDPGWHLYSLSTPPGPIATTIKLADNPAVEKFRVFEPKPERKFDPNFNADTETYVGRAVFLLDMQLKKDAATGAVELTAEPRYQVCSDISCIPPVRRQVKASLTVDAAASFAAPAIEAGYLEAKPATALAANSTAPADQPVFAFLAVAFGFGLASIFTPCVFPMIPITMSFFLNQNAGTRRQSIAQAGVFCLGVIVLFSGLGLLTTTLLGPFGVVQLGSNPWVNGLIAVVFLIFGMSLLGAFEITIPSAILTKLDRKSQQGGFAGTLLMGLTFALSSFACVGPFIGPLLAASVQGGAVRPFIGMVTFSAGLSLPFFVLALFPAYLKKLPRSGGWLVRVKMVMGFVILAAMLKYVNTVAQALRWTFFSRELFLAVWIVLFAMAGLFLLGYVRLPGVGKDDEIGLGRLFSGMAFVIFSIYLVPGMFGARLGELEAYIPEASQGLAAAASPDSAALAWSKNDLAGALETARRENKLVLVTFTGRACTNCHWMKANMFTRPEIAAALKNFVLVELFTDEDDAASQSNQQLEQTRFQTIAIPFYAIFDPNRQVVATFPSLTRNAQEYLAFLQSRPKGEAQQPATSESGSQLDKLPLSSLEGGTFDHSGLKGKVVVVNFWATWCVPCRKEIPEFNRMHRQLAGQGVAILGVSMDEEGATAVKPFLKGNPMLYAVALGSEKINDELKISQLPTTLVLDRSGKTVQRFEGFTKPESIESAVKQAL